MNMKPLAKVTGDVLDALTAGLLVGAARKIDNTAGTYMAVHVDRLSQSSFSVAHYYEQNGDLVCDPDGVFLKTAAGWLPVTLQLCTGAYTRALELDEHDKPVKWNPGAYRELSGFAAMWLRNIKDQQRGLAAIVAAAGRAA
jgi:hypothetical protein